MNILDRIPDVSFIDDIGIEKLQEELINDYEEEYKKITNNQNYVLPKASPYRIILNALALQLYQGFRWLDNMGKMNLLKYSRNEYLDQLGIAFGITRKQGEAAKTRIRFILSEQRDRDIHIPKGTRCTTSNSMYFETIEETEIMAGEIQKDIDCVCSVKGNVGNGIKIGEISILVDSVPYIKEVKNISVTEYGTDIESDEDLKERIYLASSNFSVAGPEGAYIYFVKEYSSLISDVRVTNPSPRLVDIRVILKGGKLPTTDFLEGLKKYISASNKRPLTDLVNVEAPKQYTYDIDLTYSIASSSKANESAINKLVEEAIEQYIEWQGSVIGRDINPSKLIALIINAGAKRVEVLSPKFTKIEDTNIAISGGKKIRYEGIEDD